MVKASFVPSLLWLWFHFQSFFGRGFSRKTTCRYIQGARFFGGSGENVMSAVPVNGDQLISEATITDGVDNSTSNFPSWRARFVGQAYKQVKVTNMRCTSIWSYCWIWGTRQYNVKAWNPTTSPNSWTLSEIITLIFHRTMKLLRNMRLLKVKLLDYDPLVVWSGMWAGRCLGRRSRTGSCCPSGRCPEPQSSGCLPFACGLQRGVKTVVRISRSPRAMGNPSPQLISSRPDFVQRRKEGEEFGYNQLFNMLWSN